MQKFYKSLSPATSRIVSIGSLVLFLVGLVLLVYFIQRQQQLKSKASAELQDIMDVATENGIVVTPQGINYSVPSKKFKIQIK